MAACVVVLAAASSSSSETPDCFHDHELQMSRPLSPINMLLDQARYRTVLQQAAVLKKLWKRGR
jgi:hypothetical protein